MAKSVAQTDSDLMALLPSTKNTFGKPRKESSLLLKKKDSKRQSQHKSKTKSSKTEDNGSSNLKKPPFPCYLLHGDWTFDKAGHPVCRTCEQKPTALKTIDRNASDPRMPAVTEGKKDVPSTPNESLNACSSQPPSSDTERNNSKLKNRNTIQALFQGLALEQSYASLSSSDASAKSTSRKKHRNESSESVSSQGLGRSIQDACRYKSPAKNEPTSRSEILLMQAAPIRTTGESETVANTQPCPKPIMKSRSTPVSTHIQTPSRRVSFEESSTSEAMMTPTHGSSETLSGDDSDCESSSYDPNASDSDLNPRLEHGGDMSVYPEVTKCVARGFALDLSNPYKAIVEGKYSRQPFSAGEFNLRDPSHERGIQKHGNGGESEPNGSALRHHSRSAENRSINTQKRKGPVHGPPHDDDDDDEERRGQRRGSKAPRDSSPPPERKLACPFFQRSPDNPPKAGSCYQHGFKGISKLKEHLYRTHENPILCPRCYQVMGTDIDSHLRACREVLSEEEHPVLDGFDMIQRLKISDRMRGKTSAEKWTTIYKILFPDDPDDKIPSPYWTDQVILRKQEAQKLLKSYETYIQQEFPIRLHRKLHENVVFSSNTGFLNGIVAVGMDALNETMAAYCGEDAASSDAHATETRHHARASRATPGPSTPSVSTNQTTHLSNPALQNPADAGWSPFMYERSPQPFAGIADNRVSSSSLGSHEQGRSASASGTRQHRQRTHLSRQQSSTIPSTNNYPCSNPPHSELSANNDSSSFQLPGLQSQENELAALSEDLQWCFSTDGGSERYFS